MYSNFPNFAIQNNGKILNLFLQNKIYDLHSTLNFVHNLSYGRNSDRSDYSLIFKENKGTCSTKYASLVALSIEN